MPAAPARLRRRASRALAGLVATAAVAGGVVGVTGYGTGSDALLLADAASPEPSVGPGDDRPARRTTSRPVARTSRPTPAAPAAPVEPSSAVPAAAPPGPVAATAAAAQPRPRPDGQLVAGIPAVALAAYEAAEDRLGRDRPGCRLDWPLLAAIGRVESDHGRFAGRSLGDDGRSAPPIRGIRLDGSRGTAVIRDSERGALDGDDLFDRAVGPMQFIPTTWRLVAVDGDGDGARDPDDLHDAALAAGVYLCGRGEVASPTGRSAAVFRYNRSSHYVQTVLALADRYAGGVPVLRDAPAGPATGRPSPAPVGTPGPSPTPTSAPPPVTDPLPRVPEDVGPASPTVVDPAAELPVGPPEEAEPSPAPPATPAPDCAGPGPASGRAEEVTAATATETPPTLPGASAGATPTVGATSTAGAASTAGATPSAGATPTAGTGPAEPGVSPTPGRPPSPSPGVVADPGAPSSSPDRSDSPAPSDSPTPSDGPAPSDSSPPSVGPTGLPSPTGSPGCPAAADATTSAPELTGLPDPPPAPR